MNVTNNPVSGNLDITDNKAIKFLYTGVADMRAERNDMEHTTRKKQETEESTKPEALSERFYYRPGSFPYLMDTGSGFIELRQDRTIAHAIRLGLDPKEKDAFLCNVEAKHYVHRIFQSLAGYHYGFYRQGNSQFIVQTSAPWIEGKQGECTTAMTFLKGLLDDPTEPDQFPTFMAWMQGARHRIHECLTGRPVRTRVQHLSIVGEKDLGKTWLIKKVIAPLLATPGNMMYTGEKYFIRPGGEGFNGGMECYPLILLDDTMKNVKEPERWNIMGKSKNILYAGAVSIEGKGKDTFSMSLPWAVIQLLNTDEESLSAFPMVGGDMDKICGLKAGRYLEMLPNVTEKEKDAIDQSIERELSALAWLVDQYQVPEHLREPTGRHRCKAYMHKALAEAVASISPEKLMLDLIDLASRLAVRHGSSDEATVIYKRDNTATDIYDFVKRWLPSERVREFDSLASTPAKLGGKLKRISEHCSGRVQIRRDGGRYRYTIIRPIMKT